MSAEREYLRIVFLAGLVITMLITGALRAGAHSTEEIEAFEEEWRDQLGQIAQEAAAFGGLSIRDLAGLIQLRAEFESRHPWYYQSHEDRSDRIELPPQPASSRTSSSASGAEAWRPLVERYFAATDVETALCLIWHESRGDPGAVNSSSGASGLFQHLPRYWPERSIAAGWSGASIFDPEANVAVAAWLRADGWHHWTPWLRGECR